jgi:hypothetical protein
MTATSLVEIGQEKIHHAITLVFHGHHIPLHRVGDRHRSLCLASSASGHAPKHCGLC